MKNPTAFEDVRTRLLPVVMVLGLLAGGPANARDNSRLDQAFRKADLNGDGRLSRDETRRFPQLSARLEGADTDGDGAIAFEEFRAALVRSLKRSDIRTDRAASGPEDRIRTITVGGRERRYRIHVPPNVDSRTPSPVVIAFHGGGGNPESMVRISGLNAKADEAGFIVVYPFGSGREPDRNLTFNAGDVGGFARQRNIDDVGFTRALLDDLERTVRVDPNRVFATGLSNGAMMAYRVASDLSDRIAAIAPVGGPMGTAECRPVRPVSIIHFHGTADDLAPFDGGRGRGVGNQPSFLRPVFRSARESLRKWVEANGCDPEPVVEPLPDRADDGMRVFRETWGNGRDGAEVVLIRIEGGGHTWPGREPPVEFLGRSTKDVSANDMMWEFFNERARGDDQSEQAIEGAHLEGDDESGFEAKKVR